MVIINLHASLCEVAVLESQAVISYHGIFKGQCFCQSGTRLQRTSILQEYIMILWQAFGNSSCTCCWMIDRGRLHVPSGSWPSLQRNAAVPDARTATGLPHALNTKMNLPAAFSCHDYLR